jgi:hypothetical protein
MRGHLEMVGANVRDQSGQCVQSGMALSAVEITPEMIRAGVEILETSSFCETSPAIAEGLAGDVPRSALIGEKAKLIGVMFNILNGETFHITTPPSVFVKMVI